MLDGFSLGLLDGLPDGFPLGFLDVDGFPLGLVEGPGEMLASLRATYSVRDERRPETLILYSAFELSLSA